MATDRAIEYHRKDALRVVIAAAESLLGDE